MLFGKSFGKPFGKSSEYLSLVLWAESEWKLSFHQLLKVVGGGGGGWVHWDYNVSSAPFVSELRLWE